MANDITIINTKDQQADEKSLEVCLQEDSVKEQAQNARELFSSLQSELDELEDDLKDGLSYLDMKNDTLLSYMIDLCNIVLRKVRGDAISGHASVERSVYYRVILEKIKAIDQRLAYQLNKVISLPDAAQENQGVNLNNLDIEIESGDDTDDQDDRNAPKNAQDDDDDEEDDEDDEFDGSVDDEEEEGQEDEDLSDVDDSITKVKPKGAVKVGGDKDKKPVGIYRPPKLRSVVYRDGKEGTSSKRHHDFDDLDNLDFDDEDNQDIVDETNVHRDNERTRYEEENYTRLPGTNPKKAKRKLKEKSKSSKGKKKFKGNKRKNKW